MPNQYNDYIYDSRAVQSGDFSAVLMRSTNLITGEVFLSAKIYQYLGGKSDIVVPRTISGYTVTEISTNAFMGNQNATRIRIPDTVTIIGENAFRNCKNLKKIWIIDSFSGKAVKDLWLSSNVFYGCENLSEIIFRNKEILTYAASGNQFEKCKSLRQINGAFKYVRANTFLGCPALEKIYIADNGFLEYKSLLNVPALNSIQFLGDIDIKNMSKREIRRIVKMEIACPANSNVIELAYMGANIQIV